MFDEIRDEFIYDKVLEYLKLDKRKVTSDYKSSRHFVDDLIHGRAFCVDLDLYGENAVPFSGIIKGINELIDIGMHVTVLTARCDYTLDKYVENPENDGIKVKTKKFVNKYLPKVNDKDIHLVSNTYKKELYMDRCHIWIDDNFKSILPKLIKHNLYLVKVRFPFNEFIPSCSIADPYFEEQPFVFDVIRYSEKTGNSNIVVDIDDTIAQFRGHFKKVCDYVIIYYMDEISNWKFDESNK